MAEKVKSVSHERLVKGYLRPTTFNKFEAFRKDTDIGKSEAVNQIVEDYFARQQPQKQGGKNSF